MIKLDDFNYSLPKSMIAQGPVRPRDSSKLMILRADGTLEHRHFRDILDYLRKDDVLVLNNTKVLANKLYGHKITGASTNIIIEGKEKELYRCRVQTRSPKVGLLLKFSSGLNAEIIKRKKDIFWLRFNKPPEPILAEHGILPTPNYIKAKLRKPKYYQTSFSQKPGSLAAPTAGLHFTKALLDKIRRKGVKIVYITLHVSFGTFTPIDEKKPLSAHKMDKEYFEISQHAAESINNRKGRLIVSGTTTFKALESAALKNGKIKSTKGNSDLFITPGHRFKIKPDLMITNFHLPKSPLLLFVSAYFGREPIMKAYEIAIKKNYRFYSFGDAMLLEK